MPVQFAPNYGQNSTFDQALQAFGLLSKVNQETKELALRNQVAQSQLASEALRQQAMNQQNMLQTKYGEQEAQQHLQLGEQQIQANDLGYQQGQSNLVSSGLQQDATRLGIYNTLNQMPLQNEQAQIGLQGARLGLQHEAMQNDMLRQQNEITIEAQARSEQFRKQTPAMLKSLGVPAPFADQVSLFPDNEVSKITGSALDNWWQEKVTKTRQDTTIGQQLMNQASQFMSTFHPDTPGDIAALDSVASQFDQRGMPDQARYIREQTKLLQQAGSDKDAITGLAYKWMTGGDPDEQHRAMDVIAEKVMDDKIPTSLVMVNGMLQPMKDYAKFQGPVMDILTNWKARREGGQKPESKPAPLVKTTNTAPASSTQSSSQSTEADTSVFFVKTVTIPSKDLVFGSLRSDQKLNVGTLKGSDREWAVQTLESGEQVPIVGNQQQYDELRVAAKSAGKRLAFWDTISGKKKYTE